MKLKTLTRTKKGEGIIKRAEKQLLNERIRNINYKIEKFQHDKYMYERQLQEILKEDQIIWDACKEEVLKRKEIRHQKVQKRQISKFEKLMKERKKQEQGGCSNIEVDDRTKQGLSEKNKWVVNLSSIPLTKEQESLLSYGPNFAISPKNPPLGEYIMNIEKVCQSLDTNTAEELRTEVYRVLRKPHHPKPNLKKDEIITMKQLKADKNCMVLTADKGVALVVIDTVDYIKKAKEILEDTNTYRVIQTDPTNKLKNKLINILRRTKATTGLQENIYRKMYPTGASPPRFYGLPKIHKKNIPLRPIVSSIGSVAYGVAKILANIIKPLMGCSEHHVQNSQMFVEEIKDMKLEKGECITSYDVVALFTSIPISSAIEVMKKKLEEDTELQNRTILPVNNILEILAFCLNNTYFVFQDTFYEQTKGAAMGSPISPIIVNIFMEAFERKALATALHPPRVWRRYVDDTWVIQQQEHKQQFLQHINTVDDSIQFTVEEANDDGSIPFLDTFIKPEEDRSFKIGVYRKPTHTDLYLPWDSAHDMASKYSVINTLTHRAHTISSTTDLVKQELQHLEKVLGACKYPGWAIQKIFQKYNNKQKKKTPRSTFHTRCHIVVPYVEGMGESLKKICRKHGVDMHFKGGRTLKTSWCHQKMKRR